MLKEVKKIEKDIKIKEGKLQVAREEYAEFLDQVAKTKYKEVVDSFFNGFSSEDVYTKVGATGESITFLRPCDESSYDKELMMIYPRTDWDTGEFTDIQTSVYSTSDNSLFELERLQLVGEVSSILIDFQDDILAALTQCQVSLRGRKKVLRDACMTLEAEIQSLEAESNNILIEAAKEKLNSEGGMLFDKEGKARVDVAWDYTVGGVKKARILSKTASGKSATLELTSESWDPKEGDLVRTFKNVRMSNVDALLYQYRDKVLVV